MSLHLYPTRKVVGQSYVGVKEEALPSQSMSLGEIIKRFIRRESLPVAKQGVYHEGFGDLEKMQHDDLTVNEDRVRDLKSRIKKFESDTEAAKKAEAEKLANAAKVKKVSKGGGEPLVKPPTPKGS